jgi:hypothetical protein
MTKTLFALAIAAALGGCSLFEKPATNWQRPSGTSDQTSADLTACRAEADAVIQRDADIDRDIAAARLDTADPMTNTTLVGVDDFERNNRHRRIVNDCMRQRGYVLPEENPLLPD